MCVYDERIKAMLDKGLIDDELVSDISHTQISSSEGDLIGDSIFKCITKLKELRDAHNSKWVLIAQLIDWSKYYREDIIRALAKAFMSYNPDAAEARAHVLRTIINGGYKFYPIDLKSHPFRSVRVEFPLLWINAWIHSGMSSQLPVELKELSENGENVNILRALCNFE